MNRFILNLIDILFTIPSQFLKESFFKLIFRIDKEKVYINYILDKYYNIKVGCYSYGCHLINGQIESGTVIGRFCSIAPGVRIGGLNHPLTYVSTHPFLYNSYYGFVETDKSVISKKVIIEDDVWIGFNSIVLGGVKVGKGAVIGAGSVVVKDVPAYSIVAGNPAKVIRYRFSEQEIQKLQDIDWCSFSSKQISDEINSYKNIDVFLSRYYSNKN